MGNITRFANELQTTRMDLSLTKQAWQPIASNTKDYVVSAVNMGIAAGAVHIILRPNGFKFQVGNNKSEALCYYCGEKEHYMRDCQVKNKKADMIKMSETKKFGNVAADEEEY